VEDVFQHCAPQQKQDHEAPQYVSFFLGGDTLDQAFYLGAYPWAYPSKQAQPRDLKEQTCAGRHYDFGRYTCFVHRFEDGRILALNAKGMVIYDQQGQEQHYRPMPANFPTVINYCIDMQGRLWLATTEGLCSYDLKRQQINAWLFKGEYITDIFQDREGNFWVSTLRQGIYFFASADLSYYAVPGEQFDNLTLANGRFWLGSKTGKLYAFQGDSFVQHHYAQHKYPFRNAQWDEQRQQLYLANNFCYIPNQSAKGLRWNSHTNVPKYVVWDSLAKVFLVGSLNGFLVVDDRDSLLHRSRNHGFEERIHYIKQLDQGTYLLSSTTESWCFTWPAAKLWALGDSFPLLRNRIVDAQQGPDGRWYLASRGGGLLIWDRAQCRVEQIAQRQGLTTALLHCLWVQSPQEIWLGSNQGLDKLILDQGIRVQHFSTRNFLPSNGVNQLCMMDSMLWLATDAGLVRWPLSTLKHRAELPLHITRMAVNGLDLPLLQQYHFNYLDQNIQIHFEGIRFTASEQLEYRYRLLGLDSTWYHTRYRTVQYGHLPPGYYVFELAALQVDGRWTPPLRMAFVKSAAWWQTIWARLVLFSSILGFIWWLWWRSQANIRLEKRMLQAEQKALRAQINPHFISNALSSIALFVRKNDRNTATSYLARFAALIRFTFENSQKEWISLEQELASLRSYLDLEFLRLAGADDQVLVEVAPSLSPKDWWIPPMLLQPLVENAVLHGLHPREEGRRLRISAQPLRNGLYIEIEDNGIGRQAAATVRRQRMQGASGLQNCLERIRLLNRYHRIQIELKIVDLFTEDKQPRGTRVELWFPYFVGG
jgi:two-component sensor histidine kinase